jgi:hypothetical protein
MTARHTESRPDSSRPEEGQAQRLARLQRDFAAHIRDPESHPAPAEIEDRRMAIYRRLFFNNINSLLAANFPVLRMLHDDARWRGLTRDFYANYRCQTPLFPEVAREFLRYLQDHRGQHDGDPPFMLELAHYEWVELALSLDEHELDQVAADPAGDLLSGRPVLSPLAWALSYRFPVHRIKPGYEPTEAPAAPTHILVYRNRSDDVKFMQLNDVTRLLLHQLQESPQLTGSQHLQRIADAIGHPDPSKVSATGAAVLQDLHKRDIVLGTRPG